MLLLKKPSKKTIEQFIIGQQPLSLSYKQVGITRNGSVLPGYGTDHVRGKIGNGADTFERAIAAFKKWQQFEVGWVEIYPKNPIIEKDSSLAVLAWHGCFWSLNACRIVYTIEEQGPIHKFGFGYGTLPDHAETGEERFLLEWDTNTDIVSYDILAFSNPHQLVGWLAYPIVRIIQNSFRRDSEYVMMQKLKSHS